MPEDVAVAAPAAAPADTGAAQSAEPTSINFDFGEGETVESRFEDSTPQPERFPDWDKAFDERYAGDEHKDILKMAKDGHFREKAWRDTGFRSAKEVRAYQQSVNELAESLGRTDGLKGVDAIKAEAQEWATVYAGLASGDLGVAETFFRENPEAVDKLTPAMLSIWHKSNPDSYNSVLARVMMNTLGQPDSSGMTMAAQLNQIESLLGDNAQGKKIIQAIRERMAGYEELANRKPEQKPPDFDARARELDARERSLGLTTMQSAAAPIVSRAVSQAVKQLTKGRNIPAETLEKIETELGREFQKNQIGDTDYQRNLQDLLRSGDQDKVLKLLKSKIGRSMATVAREVVRPYLSMQGKPEPRSEAAAGGVDAGPKKMPWSGPKAPTGQGPHPDVIDFAKMRQKHGDGGMKEMLGRGEFYAKGQGDTIFTW